MPSQLPRSVPLSAFMQHVVDRHPHSPHYHQAIHEVLAAIWPLLETDAGRRYREAALLDRLIEPERTVVFRVAWQDDHQRVHVNRGFRVQMNGARGPYKGGLRFHPSVDLDTLEFLAFEQTFKNALTGLPLGSGKGGADFEPKGRSDAEVMRFCQAFMTELQRWIGPETDVPAGDIGVGGREIGYLFGQYRRLSRRFDGALTGKGVGWGGSEIRTEATGYGLIFFVQAMLATRSEAIAGKTITISGAGNVAQHAAEKAIALGAKVVSLSDSNGCIVVPAGLDAEQLAWIKQLVNVRRGRIHEVAEQFTGVEYHAGARPWAIPCDIALPCATQNELTGSDALTLIQQGCTLVAEGANMPCTREAVAALRAAAIQHAPGKAANAGGVATSGFEMAQNGQHMAWPREQVESRLREVMTDIHRICCERGRDDQGWVDYVAGANIAGFVRVADAMLDQGVV
jgi:glutamate dehydrogenase (NADP+)